MGVLSTPHRSWQHSPGRECSHPWRGPHLVSQHTLSSWPSAPCRVVVTGKQDRRKDRQYFLWGRADPLGGLLWGGLLTPRSSRASPGLLQIGQDVIPCRHFLSVHREDEHRESVHPVETALGVGGSGHVTVLGKNRGGTGGPPRGCLRGGT